MRDFPRPVTAVLYAAHVRTDHGGHITANTQASVCTFETCHLPSRYIPPGAIALRLLRTAGGGSLREWRRLARYCDVVTDGMVLPRVGWSYPDPTGAFAILRDHVAFYAADFDRCSVDGETLVPQPGSLYGGWITSDLAGSFKGIPGSMGW